jgi:RNA polymerase sigma-70 factor (ECF subfamily)
VTAAPITPLGQDRAEFARLADPYRRELLEHCYRMVGSVHDAEDLVQETYLRAWRGYPGFERRATLRTWLHRIATRTCLTAIERRRGRALPAGLGGPAEDVDGPLAELPGSTWLEPLPDALAGGWQAGGAGGVGWHSADGSDPATVVADRAGLRLALVAALQHLPPRQRAVLLLRDVLAWRAAEVAELLGTSPAAVNSALQRARAHLAAAAPTEDRLVEPDDPRQRALLDRYAEAFEQADTVALTRLLTADATWEMPPYPTWVRGRDAVAALIAAQCPGRPGDTWMVATRANGCPAFGAYHRDSDGVLRAHGVHVLQLVPGAVAGVVAFLDPALFPAFDLAPVLYED